DAEQRGVLAVLPAAVGVAGGLERLLLGDQQERTDLRIERADPVEIRLGQLKRGDRAAAQLITGFGQGEVGQHGWSLAPGWRSGFAGSIPHAQRSADAKRGSGCSLACCLRRITALSGRPPSPLGLPAPDG